MDGEQQTTLTNLDGLYAANDIEAGTVVFRESDMPDCELHRTNENPNCEIVELEDGEGGIVSCRSIKAGEFFCIMESDDDSDDEGEFETDDEEEEE
jgi:U3 small nucleolar RNA-associated protein 6